MAITLIGRSVISGQVSARALVSNEPLSFWGGYDYRSGKIIDRRHPLAGKTAAGRVLALPHSRGSSTTTEVLLEAVKTGRAPAAIITRVPDAFFALASIVADEMYARPIPLVVLAREDYNRLKTGQRLTIEPDGQVAIGD